MHEAERRKQEGHEREGPGRLATQLSGGLDLSSIFANHPYNEYKFSYNAGGERRADELRDEGFCQWSGVYPS